MKKITFFIFGESSGGLDVMIACSQLRRWRKKCYAWRIKSKVRLHSYVLLMWLNWISLYDSGNTEKAMFDDTLKPFPWHKIIYNEFPPEGRVFVQIVRRIGRWRHISCLVYFDHSWARYFTNILYWRANFRMIYLSSKKCWILNGSEMILIPQMETYFNWANKFWLRDTDHTTESLS